MKNTILIIAIVLLLTPMALACRGGAITGKVDSGARVHLFTPEGDYLGMTLGGPFGYFTFGNRPCGSYLAIPIHRRYGYEGQQFIHQGDTFVEFVRWGMHENYGT